MFLSHGLTLLCKRCILSTAAAVHTISAEAFVSFTGPFYNMTPEERIDADNRSVYVGNVRRVCLSSSA